MNTLPALPGPSATAKEASLKLYTGILEDLLAHIKKNAIALPQFTVLTFIDEWWEDIIENDGIGWSPEDTDRGYVAHQNEVQTGIHYAPLERMNDDQQVIVFRDEDADRVGLALFDEIRMTCTALDIDLFFNSLLMPFSDKEPKLKDVMHLFTIASNLRGVSGPLQ